jgi:hypothetical protein
MCYVCKEKRDEYEIKKKEKNLFCKRCKKYKQHDDFGLKNENEFFKQCICCRKKNRIEL